MLSGNFAVSWRAGGQIIAVLLCALLGLPSRSALAAQAEGAGQLNIAIVEGDGAVNNLRQRVTREPIVRVEDENHKPVAGAAVMFILPGNGAGGVFANGTKILEVVTDANGQAVARGIHANNVSGQYQIQVRATLGNRTGRATISQSNAAGAGGAASGAVSGKLIAVLVIVGVAAAAGIAIGLTRGGGSSSTSSTPSTVLTPGTPTVGAPQ